jgi:hypothetical protein
VNLREEATAHLRSILEDSAGGFGWATTVTDPDGTSAELTGFQNDTSMNIDPETGVAVVGRQASVALPLAALAEAGLGEPRGIADSSLKPWVVRFTDLQGRLCTFKVSEAIPDRAGIVVLMLEAYTP